MASNTDDVSVNHEERTLDNLSGGFSSLYIDTDTPSAAIRFSFSPDVSPEGARLFLGLRPASGENSELVVSVNGSRGFSIRPDAGPVEAEIEIPSRNLQTGLNEIRIALANNNDGAWLLDGRRSRLRVSYSEAEQINSLADTEAMLMASFPQVQRVFIQDLESEVMLEALAAQAIAVRTGIAPDFVESIHEAELAVAFELDANAEGPAIHYRNSPVPTFILSGRTQHDLEAAARLFATRSLASAGDSFGMTAALTADDLGREYPLTIQPAADLSTIANARNPFNVGRGAQTAVVITEPDGLARLASLSILARTAATSRTAWVYAWYGTDSDLAPEGRHMAFIGTNVIRDPQLLNAAPAEFRSALRSAADATGRRSGLRLSSAAYAAETSEIAGVATVFEDYTEGNRWIAAFTSPEPSAFTPAASILSRSDLWTSLSGIAAVWDENGVTSFDYSAEGPPTIAQRLGMPEINPRQAALLLFSLAFLFIARGMWRARRRVHDKSRGWR